MQDNHSITLTNRKKLVMTGIVEVESSNDNCIKLSTKMGKLGIYGSDLSIEVINTDNGDFSLNGTVKKIEYKTSGDTGKFSSLFK